MFNRVFTSEQFENESYILLGPRQTGKSTLLFNLFPDAKIYDLLENNTFERLKRNPSLLRQELEMLEEGELVIIDEIQTVPELLSEVQWLIVRKGLRFILSGSSARKLRRGGVNLLGGRALLQLFFPFVSAEIEDFDIIKAVNQGMLPRHYLANEKKYWNLLQAYVALYLREEIKAESLVRNLTAFNRFLEVAALADGEMVNYNNIASDCGVDAKTVKEYFSILQDTLVGHIVPAYCKVIKRKLRQSPKFYFFDVSIPNFLLGRRQMQPGGESFEHAFEHLIVQEIIAYLNYKRIDNALSYWHTYNNYEVDVVIGDAEVAVEIKSCTEVQSRHLRSLKAFNEEHPEAHLIIVSLDVNPRLLSGVEVLPAKYFLKQLWDGRIF